MMKTILGLVTAVALLAAAGRVEAGAEWGTLTFSSTQSSESGQATTVSGSEGAVRFTGSVETPTPCYEVTGAHREQGKRITLTVTATATEGFCAQVLTYNNYQGEVSGLSAGTYDFRIVHVVDGRSQTVHSEQVTVT